MEKILLGELFSGPGGIALGADMAFGDRISHVWASDYDKDACNTYLYNILNNKHKEKIFCQDVKSLDIESLPAINAFAYGFPCNDFSIIGEKNGINGTYGSLYKYGLYVLKKFKPLFFVAENVSGITSDKSGSTFNKILSDMYSCGYNLFPHKYFFEQYGIPQARHRIIIVGIRKDLNLVYHIPSPHNIKVKTCKEAIENPPIKEDAKNNEKINQSSVVTERLLHIKPGKNVFTSNLPSSLKIKTNTSISQIYKRLDPNKPSYTVTGSGGGGTFMYHWSEPRALTNRERARLQTFPDDFIFFGSKESVRKQIGMAVPPEGARIIFDAILKTFDGIDYESIPRNISWNNYTHNNLFDIIKHHE